MALKLLAGYEHFEALDIRAGRIIKVDDSASKKPTYRMTIDFGPEIGHKISCGAYRNYSKEALLGKQVIGVINFGAKKMGPELSEVLVLGLTIAKGETIYLTTESEVPLGNHVF
jgi:tRNA-binding protein